MPRSLLRTPLLTALTLTIALAGGAAAVAAPLPAAAAADVAWSVETAKNEQGAGRSNFSYDLDPGAVVRDAMIVTNTGQTKLTLAVYAADAFTTSAGDLDLLPGGTPSVNAGTWIKPSVDQLVLAPGEASTIDFTLTVPADAAPGDHPAGLVTSLRAETNATVNVDRRLGSRINLRVSGELAPKAQVTDVTVAYDAPGNPFELGTATVRYTLVNTGNTRITADDAVEVGSIFGIGAAKAPAGTAPEVVPGSSVDVVREVRAFSLGWLGASVTVTPAGVGLGEAVLAPITVTADAGALPWTLYAVLFAVLLVVAAAIVVPLAVRARRARVAEAAPRE